MAKLAVVIGDQSICMGVMGILSSENYEVEAYHDSNHFLELLNQGQRFDLALIDANIPPLGAAKLLRNIQAIDASLPCIAITYSDKETVEFLKQGATDYLLKPFSIDLMFQKISAGLEGREHEKQKSFAKSRKKQVDGFVRGPNKEMQQVYQLLEKVAASNTATVLIQGETGTGKEHIARSIHKLSKRKAKPFVEINASALPADLLESELFGHEAGAFTGAAKRKEGLFSVASGGTLFLDEIGDMDLSMQAKILRALQDRSIRRVGGTEQIPIDIRLLTATHRDLALMVEEGSFREDLFYRLNVIPIHLPPLRERQDDIDVLSTYFVEEFAKESEKIIRSISPSALLALRSYAWPGNIRQLRNVLERAVLLECHTEQLELVDLQNVSADFSAEREISLEPETQGFLEQSIRIGANIPLDFIEKAHIKAVLEGNRWNKLKAAEILGIDRSTLYNKLKKYEIVKTKKQV